VESVRFSDGKGALQLKDIGGLTSKDYFFMFWLKAAYPQKVERQWLMVFPSDLSVYFEDSQLKIVQGGSTLALQTDSL